MDFEWDPTKARANESKHRISFFQACEAFDGDNSSTIPDPDHSQHEDRYLIFGLSKGGKYLVESYTDHGDRIRLISAREMTPRERKAYER